MQSKLPEFHEIIDRAVAAYEGRASSAIDAAPRSMSIRPSISGGAASRAADSPVVPVSSLKADGRKLSAAPVAAREAPSASEVPASDAAVGPADAVQGRVPLITPAALEPFADAALTFESRA